MRELLTANGVPEEDIDYYYIFEEEATDAPAGSVCALVALCESIAALPLAKVQKFDKVVAVGAAGSADGVDGLVEGADLAVLGLSELRALTICSYAALTKGC